MAELQKKAAPEYMANAEGYLKLERWPEPPEEYWAEEPVTD